jgi:hypothetical protein
MRSFEGLPMKRRQLILLLGTVVAGWPRSVPGQQEKLSKAQAEYQDGPKGIAMCATCTLFVAPRACKIVEGDISPNGWCKAYAMAD